MIPGPEDDRELVRRSKEGDQRAFGQLVERYQKPLFNAAFRMAGDTDVAEDLTQTAFVRAYEGLISFDTERKFFSWLYRILVNVTLDYLRHQKYQEPIVGEIPSEHDSPDEKIERKEQEDLVQDSLMEIPAHYRATIVLRHFHDLSYEEIGHILDIAESKVKSRLFTARMLLREVMIKKGYRHDAQ